MREQGPRDEALKLMLPVSRLSRPDASHTEFSTALPVQKQKLHALLFKLLGSALDWSKVTVKIFIMLQKIFISSKCCAFDIFIHKKKSQFLQTYYVFIM